MTAHEHMHPSRQVPSGLIQGDSSRTASVNHRHHIGLLTLQNIDSNGATSRRPIPPRSVVPCSGPLSDGPGLRIWQSCQRLSEVRALTLPNIHPRPSGSLPLRGQVRSALACIEKEELVERSRLPLTASHCYTTPALSHCHSPISFTKKTVLRSSISAVIIFLYGTRTLLNLGCCLVHIYCLWSDPRIHRLCTSHSSHPVPFLQLIYTTLSPVHPILFTPKAYHTRQLSSLLIPYPVSRIPSRPAILEVVSTNKKTGPTTNAHNSGCGASHIANRD